MLQLVNLPVKVVNTSTSQIFKDIGAS